MGKEIERKFLVCSDAWRGLGTGALYRQGYLSTHANRSVRVRVIADKAYLTIKGRSENGVRTEFEYQIPLTDASIMLNDLCERPLIEKTRFRIPIGDYVWEVDEFAAANAGLIIAEVELQARDAAVDLPDWIGEEVTDNPRYLNANLIANPYKSW